MRLDALHVNEPLAAEDFGSLINRVSPERRRFILRFQRRQDAQRALFARVLLQAVAAASLDVSPECLFFSHDDHGKPVLASHEGFHFNLSHSGSWVVCASDDSPLGVDVERVRPLDPVLFESVLSTEERLAMEGCLVAERAWRFFLHWIVKESYSKALGLGLFLPFHNLTVRSDAANEARVWLDQQPVTDWFFQTRQLDAVHPLCLCSRTRSSPVVNAWSSEGLVRFFAKFPKRDRRND